MDQTGNSSSISRADINAALAEPAIASLLANGAPVFVASSSPADVVFASPAAEVFFGASGAALTSRLFSSTEQGARRLAELASILRPGAPPRLEKLRFTIGRRVETLTCLCRRVEGATPLLVVGAMGVRVAVAPPMQAAGPTLVPSSSPAAAEAPGHPSFASGSPLEVDRERLRQSLSPESASSALAAAIVSEPAAQRPVAPSPTAAFEAPVHTPLPRTLDETRGDLLARFSSAPTVRFLWKSDAQGRLVEITGQLCEVVGCDTPALIGQNFPDHARLTGADPDGRLAAAMARRETWSGLELLWPIGGSQAAVPVSLGALPSHDRAREFDGFRGFGVIHIRRLSVPAAPADQSRGQVADKGLNRRSSDTDEQPGLPASFPDDAGGAVEAPPASHSASDLPIEKGEDAIAPGIGESKAESLVEYAAAMTPDGSHTDARAQVEMAPHVEPTEAPPLHVIESPIEAAERPAAPEQADAGRKAATEPEAIHAPTVEPTASALVAEAEQPTKPVPVLRRAENDDVQKGMDAIASAMKEMGAAPRVPSSGADGNGVAPTVPGDTDDHEKATTPVVSNEAEGARPPETSPAIPSPSREQILATVANISHNQGGNVVPLWSYRVPVTPVDKAPSIPDSAPPASAPTAGDTQSRMVELSPAERKAFSDIARALGANPIDEEARAEKLAAAEKSADVPGDATSSAPVLADLGPHARDVLDIEAHSHAFNEPAKPEVGAVSAESAATRVTHPDEAATSSPIGDDEYDALDNEGATPAASPPVEMAARAHDVIDIASPAPAANNSVVQQMAPSPEIGKEAVAGAIAHSPASEIHVAPPADEIVAAHSSPVEEALHADEPASELNTPVEQSRQEAALPPLAPADIAPHVATPATIDEPTAIEPLHVVAPAHPLEPAAHALDHAGDGLAHNATAVLDRLPVGVLVSRLETPIYLNRALLDLLGFASADLFHEAGGLDRMFHGRQPEDLTAAANGGTIPIVAASGDVLAVEGRLQTIDWDGAPATLMSFRKPSDPDLLPHVRSLEAELRQAESSNRELHAILDTATDGVATLDQNGRILSLNRSAEALFGYEQNEVAGEPFTILLAPESHATANEYLAGLRANGVASLLNDGRDAIGRARQGGAIPVFMTLGRLGASGQKFCAVLRDMTQWKKVERELRDARREAERASQLKSDFLAKISHEIRTPLNAILGFAEVIMDERFGPVGNQRYKDYLKDIHASGGHVMSLVNDLLDLSKIEAGKLDLNFGAVDANKIVTECVSLIQPQATTDRVIVRTALASRLPRIVADERSLRQIVLNLLSNAVKFNEPGGQVIVSTALTDAGHAVLRIKDTGVGMSESEVQTALEPFRQIQTSRAHGGTGLGLPLTKALVEANRASFTIRSKKNEGTLVEVSFPSTRVLAE